MGHKIRIYILSFYLIFAFFASDIFAARILLLGSPGSGKNTQGQFLRETYFVPFLSIGKFLKDLAHSNTSLSAELTPYLESGKTIPEPSALSDAIFDELKEILKSEEFKEGFILDGIKTIHQAIQLDHILDEIGAPLDAVIFLNNTHECLVERLSHRLVCENCGATYNEITNPPEIEGTCNSCPGCTLAKRRSDDVALAAFTVNKQGLLDYYRKNDLIIEVEDQAEIKQTSNLIVELLKNKKIFSPVKDPSFEQHFTHPPEELVQYFKNNLNLKGKTVIEFGVGSGNLTELILMAKPKKVIGYELAPMEMLPSITAELNSESPRLQMRYRNFYQESYNYLSDDSEKYVIISNPPYSAIPFIQRISHKYNIKDMLLFSSPKYLSTCADMTTIFKLDGLTTFTPPARGEHFILVRGNTFPRPVIEARPEDRPSLSPPLEEYPGIELQTLPALFFGALEFFLQEYP